MFTDKAVKALKPRSERYTVMEEKGGGLAIRITPNGTKTWVYIYRFKGRQRRMTIGTYPKVPIAKAHTEKSQAYELLKEGIDPIEHKTGGAATPASTTVEDLANEYLAKWAEPRKRSAPEDRRILFKEVVPLIGVRPIMEISRREITGIVQGVAERGAPVMANRVLAVVRKMFNYAITAGLMESSPCSHIPAPSKEHHRDRVLSEDEIRAFWSGVDMAGMTPPSRFGLKLILSTAQRKGEVTKARWSDIDFQGRWWTIPAEVAKNNLAHRVPLSDLAVEILAALRTFAGASVWVLPSPRTNTHFDEVALTRAVARMCADQGLTPFTPHDLRRTAATMMTSMGVPRLVLGKILNHVEPGVTAIYDRHSYDAEKREALEVWGRKLSEIVQSTTLSAGSPTAPKP